MTYASPLKQIKYNEYEIRWIDSDDNALRSIRRYKLDDIIDTLYRKYGYRKNTISVRSRIHGQPIQKIIIAEVDPYYSEYPNAS
jgi:hypothetical protein